MFSLPSFNQKLQNRSKCSFSSKDFMAMLMFPYPMIIFGIELDFNLCYLHLHPTSIPGITQWFKNNYLQEKQQYFSTFHPLAKKTLSLKGVHGPRDGTHISADHNNVSIVDCVCVLKTGRKSLRLAIQNC